MDEEAHRWKIDVENKLARVTTFADKYEALLDILIKRETERASPGAIA